MTTIELLSSPTANRQSSRPGRFRVGRRDRPSPVPASGRPGSSPPRAQSISQTVRWSPCSRSRDAFRALVATACSAVMSRQASAATQPTAAIRRARCRAASASRWRISASRSTAWARINWRAPLSAICRLCRLSPSRAAFMSRNACAHSLCSRGLLGVSARFRFPKIGVSFQFWRAIESSATPFRLHVSSESLSLLCGKCQSRTCSFGFCVLMNNVKLTIH